MRRSLSVCELYWPPRRPVNRWRRNSCTVLYHTVPVKGLRHMEATVMLASGPLRIVAVYLLPSRPLIDLELSACLGGSVPFLMAGDLNAKHMDWNSRLITTGGRLGCNYANENSCLIYGSDTPTMVPYNSSTNPGVLDIVLKKKKAAVYLTACSALV